MESGWKIKSLHRMILLSATYRQSNACDPAKFTADPDNRLWGRMNRRRLDLEQMRDSLVLAAGRLETREIGGKSVDLWSEPFSGKRAVYGFVDRQNLPGVFRTFDFASPDSTNAQRFRTTVPQQALFFMNSPFSMEQARAIADSPEIKGAGDDGKRIRLLYRRLFGRFPDADETKVGLTYLRPSQPLPSPASVWQYGYGDGKIFTPLSQFTGSTYQVGSAFPDPNLGYLILNGDGGHPGRDAKHSIVRRWVAPFATTVQISGVLGHPAEAGDGVRGRVLSAGNAVGEWTVHKRQAKTDVAMIAVRAGDVIDFVVDSQGGDNSDAFGWPVKLTAANGAVWESKTGFGPPPPPPVTRLVLYAQALLMTNEFMFVD
jgi:hypothetical protein